MKITLLSVIKAICNPQLALVYMLAQIPTDIGFRLRLEINAIDRMQYAYCLWLAAREAHSLGIQRISAIEFGVGGGNGLLALEKIAQQVTKLTHVEIDIYGFDLGKGLPKPKNYRDLPFIWKTGFFKMDTQLLQKKLNKSTTLILGDVSKTVPKFIKTTIAPVGFVSFDLDYYSSTIDALHLFSIQNGALLPRVLCYFDDITGDDDEIYSQYTGELLAITEFNKHNRHKKLDRIPGLIHKRAIKNDVWYDKIYALHVFDHKKYNDYTHDIENRQ